MLGCCEQLRGRPVLDRGTVAHSWRTQRWDSFTLLSPNWQTRLPGWRYHGADPEAVDGHGRTAAEVLAQARRTVGG